jgi:hypothetical protein
MKQKIFNTLDGADKRSPIVNEDFESATRETVNEILAE